MFSKNKINITITLDLKRMRYEKGFLKMTENSET